MSSPGRSMVVSFRLIRDERWEKVTKNRHFGRELWGGGEICYE